MKKKNRKKMVLILGATGMLGSAVYGEFKDKYDLVLAIRNRKKLQLLNKRFGEVRNHRVVEFSAEKIFEDFKNRAAYPGKYLKTKVEEIGEVDRVINCIGFVIAPALKNPEMALFVNGAFPHILARIYGPKLIHVSTDCVFNGEEGFPYYEDSPVSPVDVYGLAKSLGEPGSCLTLRTSLVGPELEGFSGLMEWFLHQKCPVVNGFTNHFWNGLTTKEYGRICDQIISRPEKFPRRGLFHVFSKPVSKYQMLKEFKEKYHMDVQIKKDGSSRINRVLSTKYSFNSKLKIPTFSQMLADI